jgi:transcriptional regulator with XRE-family HTH domain
MILPHMRALRLYLESTGTSHAALARRVGVSQPTIWNIANGKHSASTDLLKRICRETGLSADDLLADEATPGTDHAA